MRIEILKILDKDCSLAPAQIAAMLNLTAEAVAAEIKEMEHEGIILGYKAVIDWDKTGLETTTALIDVKVTPQRGEGFDRVASRIYQFDEVESLYLMSGGYDLSVLLTGRTFKEVAMFVAQKLAPMESVTGTATHFLLKKYKEHGTVFSKTVERQERMMSL